MHICYRPIGVLHTPFQDPAGMPIQPTGAAGIRGAAEIYPKYGEGLQDLEGVDMLDGTPLLDVKPYIPEFDTSGEARLGWLEAARGRVQAQRSDDRFETNTKR